MKISIVIIVKNDRGVADTLQHLYKKINNNVEIIVVDSSKPKLHDIYKRFQKVQWIDFVSKSKNKISIPEQRNIGVKKAKGEIIVFIDANCIPVGNWLETLIKPIIEYNEKIVCGRARDLHNTTHRDDFPVGNKNPKYIGECATINLAIHKDVFKKVGYFDESFQYGSDLDFTWRAVDSGFKIRYVKDAVIKHDWGDVKHEMKRAFRYGQGRAKVYKKHPKRIKQLITQDYFFLFYIVFLLGLPLVLFFPYYPFLLVIPFVKNIYKKPFQTIADHFCYAVGFLLEVVNLT